MSWSWTSCSASRGARSLTCGPRGGAEHGEPARPDRDHRGWALPALLSALALACSILPAGCATTEAPASSTVAVAEPIYYEGAVACDHPLASEAGCAMLRQGGNAVDAAVAASFCLSVVRPYSCGLGGGGFMIIAWPGDRVAAINYRETAPAAVDGDYYLSRDPRASRFGVHAPAVPGTVAGLLHALERYGTLDRATVLAPAIRAAREGFPADESAVEAAQELAERVREHPELRSLASPLLRANRDGRLEVGDRLTNAAQARALELIARDGAAVFYEGQIAGAIASVMAATGGVITLDDLAHYEIDEPAPLIGRFDGAEIISMPPPSSGGIAVQQILGLLDRVGGRFTGPTDPEYIHMLTEASKHAFADRAAWLADPAFVDVPLAHLLSADYLDERAETIDRQRTQDPSAYGTGALLPADGGTSHISVVDGDGLAVACTETINTRFGSLVAVPGFGFALNNQMDDFTTRPGDPNFYGLRQSEDNVPRPGKRPLSSMSPTIVRRDGRVVLVAGASGGPRIISGTVQCLLNCLEFDMLPREAVAAPRFHHQWMPDVLQFEETWTDEAAVEAMAGRGHETGARDEVGVVQLIRVEADGAMRAASDPRKGGRAAGF